MLDAPASRLKQAVHRHRLFSRSGALERLFTLWFRGLVYTQIWEAPRVDAEALRSRFSHQRLRSEALHQQDRSAVYGMLHLYVLTGCPPPAALFARTDVGLMPPSPTTADPTRKMTRMYRWTRHVYDATRRFYLLGRDRTLRQIARLPAGAVLEVGCGTARNLRVLDRTAPRHTLFGVDASHSMLSTARATLAEGAQDRVEGLSSAVLPVARRYAYLATVRVAAPVPDSVPGGLDDTPSTGRSPPA